MPIPSKTIKKYHNRRLYDTEESQYTSLESIKQMVLKGVAFKVVDAKTKQDLTHQTLLQILSEEETKGSPLLTTELLQLLIRFYGNPLQGMIGHYLEQSLFFLLSQQKALTRTLSEWLKHSPISISALSEFTGKKLNFWKNFQSYFVSKFPPKTRHRHGEPK